MMIYRVTKYLFWVLLAVIPASVHAQEDLGKEALALLRKDCYKCHGSVRKGDPKFNVADLNYMLTAETNLIVPGKPDESLIIQRVEADEMPLPPNKPLSKKEKALLSRWVDSGAKPPKPESKSLPKAKAPKYLNNNYVRRIIDADQQRLGAFAPNFRYMSLTTAFNTGGNQKLLSHTRAAVSKVANSLSTQQFLSLPRIVDSYGLVLAVNIRALGWSDRDWDQILDLYPYDGAPEFIRADWFVANASVPPLYYNLLDLPRTQKQLEDRIEVDRNRNFLLNLLLRAAITTSGVAFNNRVLEVHPSILGPYWISHDFATEEDDQNVVLRIQCCWTKAG
jgi:serine/threonine-protein kinase